jgi:8-amino-7-oxononanoate synthase
VAGNSLLEARVRARLGEWIAGGLLRAPKPPAGADFSSNDYLNLSTHPHLIARFTEAAQQSGCGSTGSRLLRGEREAFSALERRFAAWKRVDRALYLSSGYLANLAALTTLVERGDVVFSDAQNHASLIDGIRLSPAHRVVFPHNDVARLEELIRLTPCAGQRFVVVESLFSMDGDFAPLRDYAALCRSFGACLIVDEAHAVGVYGERGTGLIEACGVEADVCVSINTAGKALGVSGGFVAGPAWAVDYLLQRARPFVFSTAPPPPVAAALDASLDVLEREPERRARLSSRVRMLRRMLSEAGLPVPLEGSHIIPIVIGDNEPAVAVARAMQADGFDVRAIRPPTVPPGTARLRISVNAGLGDDTLARFAASLGAALRRAQSWSAASS